MGFEIRTRLLGGKRSQFQYYVSQWLPASVLIGLSSGMLMTLFIFMIQTMLNISNASWAPVTINLAGAIRAFLSKQGYTEVEGSGVIQMIDHKNKQEPIRDRALLTKFTSSVTGLGARMPGGEEGPAIYIGGSLSYLICKHILRMKEEDAYSAISIGGGACLATVLRAPLGGTLYAEEVPYKRDIDSDMYIPSFVASIIAVLFFQLIGHDLLGIQPFLPQINSVPMDTTFFTLGLAAILGIFVGIVGLAYSFIFTKLMSYLSLKGKAWQRIIISSVIVAIIVAIGLQIFQAPIAEPGFELLSWIQGHNTALVANQQELIALILIKMIILVLLLVGANSVGIFTPTLALGALLGGFYAILIGQATFMEDFYIIGMASMVSATSKTPISAMVLVLEITALPNLILHMAIAITLAYLISGDWSLDPGQLVNRREVIKQRLESKDFLTMIPIKTIINPNINPECLYTSQTVEETIKVLEQPRRFLIPVLNPQTNK